MVYSTDIENHLLSSCLH